MAWREIGKVIGIYAPDRTEIVVKDLTHDRLKTVSDRELLGLQEKGHAAPAEVQEAIEADFEVLRDACEDPEEVNPDAGGD